MGNKYIIWYLENKMAEKKRKLTIQSLVQLMADDFRDPNTQQIHLKSFMMVLKSTGLFDNFLYKQLQQNLKPKLKSKFISQKQLIQQLNSPYINNYNESQTKNVYQFLKGDKNSINVNQLFVQEQTKQEFVSKFKRQTLKEDDIKMLLSKSVKNIQKQQNFKNNNYGQDSMSRKSSGKSSQKSGYGEVPNFILADSHSGNIDSFKKKQKHEENDSECNSYKFDYNSNKDYQNKESDVFSYKNL